MLGEVKCNLGATIFKDKICVRDDKDKFICAETTWKTGQPNFQKAEAWGLMQALLLLMNLVVVGWHSGYPSLKLEFDAILCGFKTVIRCFPNFTITFIRRQANNITHLWTRVTLSYAICQIVYNIPFCLMTIW